MEITTIAPKKQQTHRRDWVKEAYDIGVGRSSAKPKREHIVALVQSCNVLSDRTNMILNFMQRFYQDVTAWRKEKGLPPMPLPKGLQQGKKI